jgi:hypothetical protein
MAIKRVLLPVGGDGSFDPLADMAFFVGEMFSAQVWAYLFSRRNWWCRRSMEL